MTMNEPPVSSNTPEQRIGPYSVLDTIARGSTSDVLRARDERAERIVAIKLLHARFVGDPEAEAVFRREADAMRRVNHPNVAHIHDSGMAAGGRPYLVMEHIYGPTLERLIRDRMALGTAQKIDLILQVAEGLQAGLRTGVVHRDVKPGNILIDSRSHLAKIVDFGLAWVVWEQAAPVDSGRAEGTPRYMSPEHCLGNGLDHRSDIYSLGATAYHFLAAQPPFDADTDSGIMERHLAGHPMPISEIHPDLPQDICTIVMRMLERDPNDRYQDYNALIADLDEARMSELARHDMRFREAHTQQGAFGPGGAPAPSMAVSDLDDSDVALRARVDSGGSLPQVPSPSLPERQGSNMGLIFALVAVLVGGIVMLTLMLGQGRWMPGKDKEVPPEVAILLENESLMRKVADSIRVYRARHGDWPPSLAARDAWGNPMRIYDTREYFVSSGADGEIATSDDWTMDFSGSLLRAPAAYRRLSDSDHAYSREDNR